ncbi:ribosome maturation factor RimP [Sinosporangium album]|uniref:Ribosome maturation factor RimP n=1 Tax=Sinosporangium album TaxID=504805 RepID=A0A1G7RV52_9ACTN|nr:ribosome maturation factor RimP [Sinosporangium album]SDG14675.1 ribosome maturation factor RimP [Sinosporangium album]
MGSAFSQERLMKLLEPVVGAEGFDLEDVTVTPAGKRRMLRVVVDRDGGVSLDDVAEVSHAVSTALDDQDAMGATPYVLEVTSPGVDRPLTLPRHWRRAKGRLVKAELSDGGVLEGRVAGADGTGVELDVAGSSRKIEYEDLARGRVQVEFRRAGDADDADDDGDEG